MSAFLKLPDLGRAALLSLLFALLIALLFLIVVRRLRLYRAAECFPPLLLLLLVLFDLVCLMDVHAAVFIGRAPTAAGHWAGSLPWAAHALFLIASGAYCAWGHIGERRVADKEITPDSIREALDNLPSGICFSSLSGIPLLTNRRLYALAEEMFLHRFRNAEELWRELAEFEARNGIECVQGGSSPAFRLRDGSVWRFTRAELTIDGEGYIQTTAADVTKLFTLSRELSENNAALHAQQERLKSLLVQIVKIKREEEILASKVKLHDELGRCVLAGRRFLLRENPKEGVEPVLALWRETVEKLEVSLSDIDKAEDDTLSQLKDAASALGCAIELEGELPQNNDTAYLLLCAVREAVTNAVRHASADKVTVQLSEKDGVMEARIEDNGVKLPARVIEGGGLINLRRKVERAGGVMALTCENGVYLHLKLPLAGKEE